VALPGRRAGARASDLSPAATADLTPALLGLPNPDDPFCDQLWVVAVASRLKLPVELPRIWPFSGNGGSPLTILEELGERALSAAAKPPARNLTRMNTFICLACTTSPTNAIPTTPSCRSNPCRRPLVLPVDQYWAHLSSDSAPALSRFHAKVLATGPAQLDEPFHACSPRAWCRPSPKEPNPNTCPADVGESADPRDPD